VRGIYVKTKSAQETSYPVCGVHNGDEYNNRRKNYAIFINNFWSAILSIYHFRFFTTIEVVYYRKFAED